MIRTDINKECEYLENIITNLEAGTEPYDAEETQYTPEEAIRYLHGYLDELKVLNNHIISQGNTQELLDKVYGKYMELYIFNVGFTIDRLPFVIGGLLHYPDSE